MEIHNSGCQSAEHRLINKRLEDIRLTTSGAISPLQLFSVRFKVCLLGRFICKLSSLLFAELRQRVRFTFGSYLIGPVLWLFDSHDWQFGMVAELVKKRSS